MAKHIHWLTIGEVARQAAVQTSTIRYYEKMGILTEVKRVNGQRRFDTEVLRILGIVRLAKLAGFTLTEIRELLEGFSATEPPSAKWHKLARQKILEVNAQIERRQQMKRILEKGLACQCLQFEDCVILEEYRG